MSDDILLHGRTANQIKSLLNNPAHAVLIIGPAGAGKRMVARYLSSRLMDVSIEKIDFQPYYIELTRPEGKSEIPIDSVRELVKGLRLKTSGQRRVVLIDEAHSLSEEAQNALLKVIEEPPENTVFMLAVTTQSGVLPTIASRSQKLNVLPAGNQESRDFFKDHGGREVDSAWSLARGGAGLMSAILRDQYGHEVKLAVDQAKLFIRMDGFERLLFLDRLAADKLQFSVFLGALSRVYAALSDAAVSKDNKGQLARLTASRRHLNKALDSMDKNVSPRLISLDLALSLRA